MEPVIATIPSNSATLMQPNIVNQNLNKADILTNIFRFLDFQAQCCASLVCKNWRQIISKAACTYGEIFSLLSVAQVQPKSCTLFTSARTGEFYIHGTIGEFTLISQEPHDLLFLIDEKGKQIPINLRDALNPQEKNHDVLKVQRLKSAIILSDQHFITVTEKGTIAMWKLSNQVVSCMQHRQVFNDEAFFHQTEVEKAFVVQNILIVAKINQFYSGIDVFDIDLQGKIEFNSEATHHFPVGVKPFSFSINNSEKIFQHSFDLDGNYFEFFYLMSENKWGSHKTHLNSGQSIQMIKCSQKWMMIAFTENETALTFRIYDAKNCSIFECQENLDRYNQRFRKNPIVLEQSVWLCENFFVFWDGEELKIWHIPKKKFIARKSLSSINLKKFFKEIAPCTIDPRTQIQNEPIIHVEIKQKEINLLLQNKEMRAIQHVKFRIDEASKAQKLRSLAISAFQQTILLITAIFHQIIRFLQYIWTQCRMFHFKARLHLEK